MLYNCHSLTLVDDIAGLDNKLLRISLEHIKGLWRYLLQYGDNGFTGESRILYELADKIIPDILTNKFQHLMSISFSDSHRHSSLQLLLALNLIHRTFNYVDIDFRDLQMGIQFINGTEDKIFCLEVNSVICLAVDLAP